MTFFKIYNRFLIILTLWTPSFKPVADSLVYSTVTWYNVKRNSCQRYNALLLRIKFLMCTWLVYRRSNTNKKIIFGLITSRAEQSFTVSALSFFGAVPHPPSQIRWTFILLFNNAKFSKIKLWTLFWFQVFLCSDNSQYCRMFINLNL